MSDRIIETFNLSKIYYLKRNENVHALDDVNIHINKGEKFGLLGPNGAGKTTLISILSTLIQPSSGYAIIDGYNNLKEPNEIKKKIALMLGTDMIYYRITGYANLKFFCKVCEVKDYKNKIMNLAKKFEIDNWLDKYVEKYSSGMKCKLSLCRVLLLDPKILFLDEPTLGLDVKTKNSIIKILKDLDKTILLTSHNMDIIDKLCSKIAFIKEGKIIKFGKKEELQKLSQDQVKIFIGIKQEKDKLRLELEKTNFITDVNVIDEGLIIELKKRDHYNMVFPVIEKYKILKIQELDLSLEDLFLKII